MCVYVKENTHKLCHVMISCHNKDILKPYIIQTHACKCVCVSKKIHTSYGDDIMSQQRHSQTIHHTDTVHVTAVVCVKENTHKHSISSYIGLVMQVIAKRPHALGMKCVRACDKLGYTQYFLPTHTHICDGCVSSLVKQVTTTCCTGIKYLC